MDKIQKLLESIDAKVLTEEVKTAIVEEFTKAVNEKAEVKAQELFTSKENEYAKALDEMVEAVTKTIQADAEEKFNESVKIESDKISQAYALSIKEEAESKINEEINSLVEKFEKYIEYSSQTFIDENEAKWAQEIDIKKSNKLQEAFVKFATSFGIDMKEITEDKTDEAVELEKAIETNRKLQEEIYRLNKEIMLDEAVKDLTAPQSDKFVKLMEEVQFENAEQFGKKIALYKSAIATAKVEEKKIVEEVKDKSKLPSWKR